MSIKEILEKIKPFYTLLIILVVGSIFFALGRLSSIEGNRNSIKIQYPEGISTSTSTANVISAISTGSSQSKTPAKTTTENPYSDGPVVGSKSGKKYYFPWCGTVKRILPQNQVHFNSIAEAKSAGFIAGGNCKGLK